MKSFLHRHVPSLYDAAKVWWGYAVVRVRYSNLKRRILGEYFYFWHRKKLYDHLH